MRIVQNLVSSSKYSIKCPYLMNPTRIVVHNTYNDASARNEISYMIGNNKKVSFHFAVDDKEIVQGIPLNRSALHAGDGNGIGNRQGVAIEICYSKSGGTKFKNAEKLASKFIAKLLKERNWNINKVTKHQDYSNKYCPHRTLDMGWKRFLNMIKAELDILNRENKTIYRVRKSWNDHKTQIGAFNDLDNAKKLCDKNKGYKVYDSNGKQIYPMSSKKPLDIIVKEVIKGDWGNGQDRIDRLTNAGYNYKEIRKLVNEELKK